MAVMKNQIEFEPDGFTITDWHRGETRVLNSELDRWACVPLSQSPYYCVYTKQGAMVRIDPGYERKSEVYGEIQRRVLANGGELERRSRRFIS